MDPAWAAQTGEAVAEKVLRYRRDAAGWTVCRESDGVSVSWRPSDEFPGNLYRGEGVVWETPEEVWDCVKPVAGGLREKWDENVASFEIVESITDKFRKEKKISVAKANKKVVLQKHFQPVQLEQDFVDLVLVKEHEDGSFSSSATHVEHVSCPPKPGYVRGFNHPCGCFCEPLPGEPDKARLVTFFHTDLSGLLPRTVVDAFFPRSMAAFYANLRAAVRSARH